MSDAPAIRKPRPTAFKPGQSGNPSGRPKLVGEVRDLARQYTTEAIEALRDIATSKSENGSARVAAAEAILNRGWGRPSQSLELSGPDGGPLHLQAMPTHELLERAREAVALLERGGQHE